MGITTTGSEPALLKGGKKKTNSFKTKMQNIRSYKKPSPDLKPSNLTKTRSNQRSR